jgi:succinate dehydrogenase / fumarate reductase cytochrome b subunit
VEYLQCTTLRVASTVIAWSVFHHLFSGMRFLLIDIGSGVNLQQARRSAWLVNIAGVAMALAYLWWVL